MHLGNAACSLEVSAFHMQLSVFSFHLDQAAWNGIFAAYCFAACGLEALPSELSSSFLHLGEGVFAASAVSSFQPS